MAALIVLASLVPITVLAVLDVRESRRQQTEKMATNLAGRADQLRDRLDEFNRAYLRISEGIAVLPSVADFLESEGTPLRSSLIPVLGAWPAKDSNIRNAILLDTSGKVRASSDDLPLGRDLSSYSFIKTALAGKAIISDIYLSGPDEKWEPTIAYISPVLDSRSHVIGLISVCVKAKSFWTIIRTLNGLVGNSSFAVLFDDQGIRIAHTYSDEIVFHPGGQLEQSVIDRQVAENRFGPATRKLLTDVRSFPDQFDRSRSSAPDSALFRGFAPVNQKWNFGVGRRFETVPWTVFYMMPEESLIAEMQRLTLQRVFFASVIILLAALVGLIFASMILRPVQALSIATQSLASGNLKTQVPVLGTDELGMLGKSFNSMAIQLKENAGLLKQERDDLEAKVLDRTADLMETQKKLLEGQRLLRSIVDNTPAVIYMKDLEGRYLLVNREYSELFHIQADDVLGKTDHDVFPKEAADAFRIIDQKVARAGKTLVEEEVAPLDDGLHTYVSVKTPLLDDDGKTYAVFGISTDITDLKRAEETIRESEARYRTLFDTLIEGFCTIEVIFDENDNPVDYRFLETNPAFERQTGLKNAQGKLMRDLAPGHEEHWFQIYGKIALTGESLMFENEAKALDRFYDVCAYRIGGAESRKVAILFNDITERKQSEKKLRVQLERLDLLSRTTRAIGERQDLRSIFQVVVRSLEDHLPIDFCCVCFYDAHKESLTVTSVGAKSELLARELAMTNKSIIDIDENGLSRCVHGHLVYEPDIRELQFPFPKRLAGGGLSSAVFAPLLVESRVFGVLIAARLEPEGFSSSDCEFLRQLSEHVALAANQAQLYSAIQDAYDELRQTQQAVMQQERLRALGQMASGIAHDINNAISPVSLYADSILEREHGLSERSRENLKTIVQAVDDVAATVARLREFYRQREDEATFNPIYLDRLVRQVIDLTRVRWSDIPQQSGIVIEVQTELDHNMPATLGVESEIREALTNLVFNAVDAMPQGGMLTFRVFANENRQAVLEVSDTGLGMTDETLRRCLEPFFTTKGERGTGLGLAMVYGIVQRHNADIEIKSEPNAGTAVRLVFPTIDEGTLYAETISPAPITVPHLRILVIDDDPVLLLSLCDTLEADGHQVVVEGGGKAGMETFAKSLESGDPFDVVITDLGMPYVDGRKVANFIKGASSSTPVILLTGWGQRLIAEGTMPAEVDKVVSKPPKIRDLREALASVLPPKET